MTCSDLTCTRQIDGGMSYRCDECGDQFCSAHLVHIFGRKGQFCEECADDLTPVEA